MKALEFGLTVLILLAAVMADDESDDRNDEGNDTEGIGTVIGIDLGTTYSRVSVYQNGQFEIIKDEHGNPSTPSYVAFTPDGERLIGEAAKQQLSSNPENTIYGVKRFIGRHWTDKTVQQDKEIFPFTLVNKDDKPHVEVAVGKEKKVFSAEDICAMVLSRLKEIAEAYLGEAVNHAVVTVPAYFTDAQRRAVKDAGSIAGLNVMRIINEPNAAAIAHGLHKTEEERNVLVYDLGGGSFDVTLLVVDYGVFEVVSTYGDTHLGGENFDQRVMEYFIELYRNKTGKDIGSNQDSLDKLRREVERAKHVLSSDEQTRIHIESLIDGEDFSQIITRAQFEELNMDLFLSTMAPVRKVLEEAEITKNDVHDIILVGGSSHTPKIQQLVKKFFDDKDPMLGISPEEAVAYGAAIQGDVLRRDDDTHIWICDIVPLSLGVRNAGGVITTIIPRNILIPTRKSHIFSTATDNQPTVAIEIYQGARPMPHDNQLLDYFVFDVPLAPRGVPQIEVTFEIDVNGILHVSAEDMGTADKKVIAIDNSKTHLTPEEIELRIIDAEEYADEDDKVKERVKGWNELDRYPLSYKTEL